jgi:hypothetical protein
MARPSRGACRRESGSACVPTTTTQIVDCICVLHTACSYYVRHCRCCCLHLYAPMLQGMLHGMQLLRAAPQVPLPLPVLLPPGTGPARTWLVNSRKSMTLQTACSFYVRDCRCCCLQLCAGAAASTCMHVLLPPAVCTHLAGELAHVNDPVPVEVQHVKVLAHFPEAGSHLQQHAHTLTSEVVCIFLRCAVHCCRWIRCSPSA